VKFIDLNTWKRKDQYLFFKDYDNPFYNICVDVDVTDLYQFTKKQNLSFFRAYFYLSLKAVNATKEFCLRIRENGVVQHDVIHAGSTVLNDDETFSFCYFNFSPDFSLFDKHACDVLKRNKDIKTLDPQKERDDLIYYSVLPWFSFKSVSHAYKQIKNDSIPRLTFGKYFKQDDKLVMPHSIEVNHALVDGLHVAKYIDTFHAYLENPSTNCE
jgi:chloramphenicol O-acetyltransferase type A